MLFVVVREIEAVRSECSVFTDLETATDFYEEAAYVVRNGPGDGPGDDAAIVTAVALYAAATTDQNAALAMTNDGRAVLMESEW